MQLATGAKVMVSGKAGWRGAERLRAEWAATERAAVEAAAEEALYAAGAAAAVPSSDGELRSPSKGRVTAREPSRPGASRVAAPPLQLQLVSFSYDVGEPRDAAAYVDARGLPNPAKAAKGRTGLDRRLAKELLASPGAAELCERVMQEVH